MVETTHIFAPCGLHFYHSCSCVDGNRDIHMQIIETSDERASMEHLMGVHNPRICVLDTGSGISKALIICTFCSVQIAVSGASGCAMCHNVDAVGFKCKRAYWGFLCGMCAFGRVRYTPSARHHSHGYLNTR